MLLGAALILTAAFTTAAWVPIRLHGALSPASVAVYRGDIDENGKIDIFDLLSLLKMISGSQPNEQRKAQIADLDANGRLNIFDLIDLLAVLGGRKQPGTVNFGPSLTIAGIDPPKSIEGDTVVIRLAGIEPGSDLSGLKGFIDGVEVPLVRAGEGDSVRLVVPGWCGDGALSFQLGDQSSDTARLGYVKVRDDGIASKYVLDEGLENDPDVLLYEGFESDNWMDRWPEVSEAHLTYQNIEWRPEYKVTGVRALSLLMTSDAGMDAAGWMHHWWDGSDVAYCRYYFRLSAGDNWGNQKIMQLHGHPRGVKYGTGAGNRPTGYDWFSTGTGVGGNNGPPWTRVILYTYHPDQIGDYGDNVNPNQGLTPKIPEEQWVCYEFMIKLNDPDQANGEQRLWINGRLYIEQLGLRWRKTDNLVINNLMQPNYTGFPPAPGTDRYLWLDAIVLAKSYIGPVREN